MKPKIIGNPNKNKLLLKKSIISISYDTTFRFIFTLKDLTNSIYGNCLTIKFRSFEKFLTGFNEILKSLLSSLSSQYDNSFILINNFLLLVKKLFLYIILLFKKIWL